MVRIGVIGYGTRIDMLMDELFALPYDARIVAVADPNPERVRALMTKAASAPDMHRLELDKHDAQQRKCPMNPDTIAFYDSAEAMLERESLDGVIVGTNCDTHTRYAKLVMARGLPLFLEKPVAVSFDQLRELRQALKGATSPVVVSFPLRVTALIREVKRLLDAGAIGKIEHVQAYNDVPYGGVYFHDWYRNEAVTHGLYLQKATHDIDVINFLVDERPMQVCAMKSKQIFKGDKPAGLRCPDCAESETCPESSFVIRTVRNDIPRGDYCCFAADTGNEDSGSLLLRYDSGRHLAYSQNLFARKHAGRRGARLYGYLGTLAYDFYTNKIEIFDHMSDKRTIVEMPEASLGHGGGDAALMGNFVRLILGKDAESVAPLEAGIESAMVCLMAAQSADEARFVSAQ